MGIRQWIFLSIFWTWASLLLNVSGWFGHIVQVERVGITQSRSNKVNIYFDMTFLLTLSSCFRKASDTSGDFIRRSRRIWSPACDFRHRLMRTHLAIFFRRSRRCSSFENSCDKIARPNGLALLAIHSNKRRKSRERADLANDGEFNRRYLTCQLSAILYADRGDRRKSQPLHRAHLAIFADRGERRIKSPSVSLA